MAVPGVLQAITGIILDRGGNFTDFSSKVIDQRLQLLAEVDLPADMALDQPPEPGDTSAVTLSGMIAYEMAIGMINNKTTATRIIPVPGKQAGEEVSFSGLFGASQVMAVRDCHPEFHAHGDYGQIPQLTGITPLDKRQTRR